MGSSLPKGHRGFRPCGRLAAASSVSISPGPWRCAPPGRVTGDGIALEVRRRGEALGDGVEGGSTLDHARRIVVSSTLEHIARLDPGRPPPLDANLMPGHDGHPTTRTASGAVQCPAGCNRKPGPSERWEA